MPAWQLVDTSTYKPGLHNLSSSEEPDIDRAIRALFNELYPQLLSIGGLGIERKIRRTPEEAESCWHSD
jgi:hypothetical protein